MNTERDFIGIEKNKKYFEIAKDRMKKVSQNMSCYIANDS